MKRRALLGLPFLLLASAQGQACAPTPRLTAGPYYLPDAPRREDLREGLPGFHLRLELQAVDRACRPLRGVRVDLWHTDALGRYSGVNAPGRFCRGYGLTDEEGRVAFLTLFPGWYPGRTPHLHLRVEGPGGPWTTQLFFSEEVYTRVYREHPPYRERGQPRVGNRADGLFRADLLLPLEAWEGGFRGRFRLVS